MDFKAVADRLNLDEEDIVEVAQLFVQMMPDELKKLIRAYQEQDIELALETAHSIKGSSSTLGMDDTAKLAQIVVKQCREQDIEALGDSLPKLIEHLKAAMTSIAQELQDRRS